MATATPLKVAVLGPAGQCGSCVVDELLSRGHTVVGISRNPPEDWKSNSGYSSVPVDIQDTKKLSKVFSAGFDAIVSAYAPPLADLSKVYETGVEGHGKIKMALLESSHEGQIIVIGGAGSLHTKNGQQLVEELDFAYSWWYRWPDAHLNYMRVRAYDHGTKSLGRFISAFKWARSNVEHPGGFSWLLRPFALLYLRWAKGFLTHKDTRSLITMSRMALIMWEGVKDKQWTFLSPPGLLRDKGVRTGKYELHIDGEDGTADVAVQGGIYNEDMAVAIVDEVENSRLTFKHWSCTGEIDLKEW